VGAVGVGGSPVGAVISSICPSMRCKLTNPSFLSL
jgi:hypothetical protein